MAGLHEKQPEWAVGIRNQTVERRAGSFVYEAQVITDPEHLKLLPAETSEGTTVYPTSDTTLQCSSRKARLVFFMREIAYPDDTSEKILHFEVLNPENSEQVLGVNYDELGRRLDVHVMKSTETPQEYDAHYTFGDLPGQINYEATVTALCQAVNTQSTTRVALIPA